MIKAIVYSDYSTKKEAKEQALPLSDTECLIRALDLLDFNRIISSQNAELKITDEEENIERITLHFKK